ncbi:hypothetical protein [Actinomadura sp. DC4]|nr:hypothetical protein [Actinomadura sp. DC4]MDN3351613.1 hypothetical protein [Actinomadura sp. DC4]
MPLAVWAMTAALAYAAGKRQSMDRKADGHGRAKAFKHRARKAATRTKA